MTPILFSGDSGGPLACKNQTSPYNFFLTGIVSHGGICGSSEPAIYMNVSAYMPFVETSMELSESDLNDTMYKPVLSCPNRVCGGECLSNTEDCKDRIVDCLGDASDIRECATSRSTLSTHKHTDPHPHVTHYAPHDLVALPFKPPQKFVSTIFFTVQVLYDK